MKDLDKNTQQTIIPIENKNEPFKTAIRFIIVFVVIASITSIGILAYIKKFHLKEDHKDLLMQIETSEDVENISNMDKLQQKIVFLEEELAKNIISNRHTAELINAVIIFNDLKNLLSSNNKFTEELNHALPLIRNNNFKEHLSSLLPYSSGVEDRATLLNQYETIVYRDMYLESLMEEETLVARIKFVFYSLVFIKSHNPTFKDTNGTLFLLNKVETHLRKYELSNAYTEFNKITTKKSARVLNWMLALEKRLKVEEVIEKIDLRINSFASVGGR